MHSSLKLFLSLILLLQASNVIAVQPFVEQLKAEAATARHQLEYKLASCKALENREVNYFDFWLQSQSESTRKNMVWDLIQLSRDGCIEQERNNYTIKAVRLAALTGERVLLDEWLNMYPEYHHEVKDKITLPQDIYDRHLQRLSHSPAFQFPFHPIDAMDAIVPDQGNILNEQVHKAWMHASDLPGLNPPLLKR